MAGNRQSIYGFEREDAFRLKRLLNDKHEHRGAPTYQDQDQFLVCVAPSGIPARSGSVLGMQTVTVKTLTSSVVGSNVNKSIDDYGISVIAYNLAAVAVAAGATIIVAKMYGCWVVIWEEC